MKKTTSHVELPEESDSDQVPLAPSGSSKPQAGHVVPLTLIKHFVRKYRVACLARQAYLPPYPAELMLRNQV
jgi:hypothetical protein